eukprot:m.435811 g.435811  ORF g.435811 m.435811 type:complete len:81 (+) comp17896_c0_seq1:859-1101(+)
MASAAVALSYCHTPSASCGNERPLLSVRSGMLAREVAARIASIFCWCRFVINEVINLDSANQQFSVCAFIIQVYTSTARC